MNNLEEKQGIRSKSRILCMPSALNTKGWENTYATPRTPLGHIVSSPHIRNQLALPQEASKRTSYFCFPPCRRRGPSKDLLESLVWPLIDFYCRKRPSTSSWLLTPEKMALRFVYSRFRGMAQMDQSPRILNSFPGERLTSMTPASVP